MEKLKIIIADDMDIISERIKNIIEKRENTEIVGIAKDGEEEKKMIIEETPDLVFTDNQMPKMNGVDVIKEFLNLDNRPYFVFVTGDRDIEIMRNMYEYKVVTIINKPFEDKDVIQAINEYMVIKENQVKEEMEVNNIVKIENTKQSLWEKIKKFFLRKNEQR